MGRVSAREFVYGCGRRCSWRWADYSVFHVFKLETMEVVAEYQGKPSLDMYANILNQIGREYGDALMVVENVGIGISVCEKLEELEYPNLYYSIKGTHEYVDSNSAQFKSGTVAGFTTSSKTRPLIVAKLEEFIRNKLITIYSNRLYNEFKLLYGTMASLKQCEAIMMIWSCRWQ